MRPVQPSKKRTAAVERPAAAIWGTERWGDSATATAAMDFRASHLIFFICL
jgi:hypothetical protein